MFMLGSILARAALKNSGSLTDIEEASVSTNSGIYWVVPSLCYRFDSEQVCPVTTSKKPKKLPKFIVDRSISAQLCPF